VDLSVVVPVYNEEENVQGIHREVMAALGESGLDFELIMVDDGSTDSDPVPAQLRSDRGNGRRIRCGFGAGRHSHGR